MLTELGVEQVFHKVRLKPGKPLWFGVLTAQAGETLVFGLPGNPVSSLVCFELFVRPALARLAGREIRRLSKSTGEAGQATTLIAATGLRSYPRAIDERRRRAA